MAENGSFHQLAAYIRNIYGDGFIPLHRPVFEGHERRYLIECIDSNFVSSVGERVIDFEKQIAQFTGAKFAIATVNGTAALHVSLQLAGVTREDEVLSQALTFIATCNAISYIGAHPVFVDVDIDSMGMSPSALRYFLENNAEKRNGQAWNQRTGRRLAACVPMHTFGLPCRIQEIADICEEWGVVLVEDAAESLGSYVGERHTGTFGQSGTFSFNGNKIITTGGGGMIITDDEALAVRAKHITTTAKIPHPYEFVHDEVGYNYRMPNLNAALGCAQMERLPEFLKIKADVAAGYQEILSSIGISVAKSRPGTTTNNWLNAVTLNSAEERDAFLAITNEQGIMTRPIWRLMTRLKMFEECYNDGLPNALELESRVANIPSSVPDGLLYSSQVSS